MNTTTSTASGAQPGQSNYGQHFTSGPYLTIKANGGTFSLRMNEGETAVDASLRVEAQLKADMARIQRQLGRLSAYLKGQTVSHPEALR